MELISYICLEDIISEDLIEHVALSGFFVCRKQALANKQGDCPTKNKHHYVPHFWKSSSTAVTSLYEGCDHSAELCCNLDDVFDTLTYDKPKGETGKWSIVVEKACSGSVFGLRFTGARYRDFPRLLFTPRARVIQ